MNIIGIFKGAMNQIRSLWKLLIGIYAPIALLFLGIGILVRIVPDLSIYDIFRDVAVIGKVPSYSGFMSQLGLLLWSASTTICFFTYFVLKKREASRKESLNTLLFAGLLSGYLMIDDTFMLHEEIFPDYIKFIPEKVVIILLGIAMLLFLYFNRREILQSEYGILLLAYGFFGFSVAIDAIPDRFYVGSYFFEKIELFLEDGAKFTAITTWFVFYTRYCNEQISLQVFRKSQ